jgi:chemotaxis protein MotB
VSGGGGGKRRVHEEEHEEHENHERWLVSYADMMTLLMVLFIVMFAISQVDQKKFMALKEGLTSGFGAPVAILTGGDKLLDVGGSVAPDSVNLAGSVGAKPDTTTTSAVNPEAVAALATASEKAQVAQEVKNLEKAKRALKKALKKAGLAGAASFRFDQRGLVVTVATDNVLFPSGGAQLQAQGRKILNVLAPTLRGLPNQLSVDGHTNSIPIHTAQFPSNWYLSGDRAFGVLQYLHDRDGIPNNRMSATGFSDTEPRLPASDPRSVTVNRRVEIVVLARVDDAAGRAITALGNDGTKSTTAGSTTASVQASTVGGHRGKK